MIDMIRLLGLLLLTGLGVFASSGGFETCSAENLKQQKCVAQLQSIYNNKAFFNQASKVIRICFLLTILC